MFKTSLTGLIALALTGSAHAAINTHLTTYEEGLAHEEEARVLTQPIAGVENKWWFNYRVNLVEAQKELSRDLQHANKAKSERGAWDEYRRELVHERVHYVKVMTKRGYHMPTVTVVG
jgi:hypothetical protein